MTVRGLIAAALVLALPAGAAAAPQRPPSTVPAGLDQVAESAHFVVHYSAAPGDPNATTAEHARSLAEAGERGYAKIVGEWGFPAPLDDGDGRTDIYVFAGTQGLARADVSGTRSTGYITYTPTGHPVHIPHEFFHLVQFAITTRERGWIQESTADWAAISVGGSFRSRPFSFARPEVPMDCTGAAETDCGGDPYGYHGSTFFIWLAEQYGPAFIREIYERAYALTTDRTGHGMRALAEALAARGSSIEGAYGAYAVAKQTGGFVLPGLGEHRPRAEQGVYATPAGVRVSPVLEHLSARYLPVAVDVPVCAPATLHVTVTAPAGATVAYVSAGGRATPVVPGTPAAIPVGGCAAAGTLVLAHGSPAAAAAAFDVDVRAEQAPSPVPRAKITGARQLPGTRTVRCMVTASAAGNYRVSFGRRGPRWSGTLRRGANRLTLRLPRGFSARGRTLTLTPLSAGGVAGRPSARRVS